MSPPKARPASPRLRGSSFGAKSKFRPPVSRLSEADLKAMDGKGFDAPGPNGQPRGLRPIPGDVDNLPGRLTIVVEKTSGDATLYRAIASVSWVGVNGRRVYSVQTLIGERK